MPYRENTAWLTLIAIALTFGPYFGAVAAHGRILGTVPDERDCAITSRSITFAYYVLITGMVVVGCVMPFNSGGLAIINAALFTIVAAELVHYGVIVIRYRRQA